ncbi:MAG: rod shape-determining protein RodA [Gammaproteobacteria bacterium]|nr:rod shape-determining protein RodA [Gammaproteobacteria bacterium]
MERSRWHIDKSLLYALLMLGGLSLVVVYSASGKNVAMVIQHGVRIGIGFVVMFVVAQIRPELLERWAPWFFAAGMALIVAVLGVGTISKGAQRWLSLGFVSFQPSEFLKLGVPMVLAWYLARGGVPPSMGRVALCLLITLVPAALIAKQPDLGTSLLVAASGLFVLFLAGLPTRLIVIAGIAVAAALPILWGHLHDYQRNRILTLIDPSADPLGSGYHTLQSMIALGSGGFYGKGWLNSSQAHLEYLPESWTDFIFAVFGEEFGLIGILLLIALYGFIAARALLIAFYTQDTFARLLAGGLGLAFFIQFFINIGMVAGILPVVGVPLPMMSYGGTSILTLMAGFGILMSIHTNRKIVEF